MKKHYSKLPPVAGPYERIPDSALGQRMVRCLVDGAEIPSLGIYYHERGTRHQVASEAVGSRRGDLAQSVRPTEWRTTSKSLTPYGRRLRIGQLKKLLAVRPLSADESAEYARLVADEREGKEASEA